MTLSPHFGIIGFPPGRSEIGVSIAFNEESVRGTCYGIFISLIWCFIHVGIGVDREENDVVDTQD